MVGADLRQRVRRTTIGGFRVILVFGGKGQLGRALARQAALGGVELLALSRSEADITDLRTVESVITRCQPDV